MHPNGKDSDDFSYLQIMSRVSNNIQDYFQRHPLSAYSIAISSIILISGITLHIGGRYLVHSPDFVGLLSLSLRYYLQSSGDRNSSVYDSWLLFVQPIQISVCDLKDHAARTFFKIGKRTRKIRPLFIALADRLKTESRQLLVHPWIARIPDLQVLTVFTLVVFSLLIRASFGSRIHTRKAATAETLHFVAAVSFVVQGSRSGDWLVAALVMVSFDVFQHALDGDANGANESQHHTDTSSSAVETRLEQTRSLVAESRITDPPRRSLLWSRKRDPTSTIGPDESKDREIVRLQWSLTDLQTAIKVKDVELGAARQELLNAKGALAKSFADISVLHNEMRVNKQTLAKKHQAIIYRKDIELFALRKGNEQKERHIQDKDAEYTETFKQQRATLNLKEAQLNVLKERLAAMERQASPRFAQDATFEEGDDGDHALEVRMLRVKNGPRSLSESSEEDKDVTIEQLRRELAAATRTAEDVVNQSAELQRAWDISKKIQNALKEERERHDQTKVYLQEASAELEEFQAEKQSIKADPAGRLPTIEENDQNELEAMFDTAQQDNLRLHAEVEALDKRVRDANARIFLADQEMDALREQLRMEHAINEDMEAARPSVVHRVHFQRLEGQLKESRDDTAKKQAEIQKLKAILVEKDRELDSFREDMAIAMGKNESVRLEIDQLRKSVTELEAAKERLMLDHERLAAQRSRQRVSSVEHMSPRTSGATLINEPSPSSRLTLPDDIPPVPALPPPGSPILASVQQRDATRSHQRNQSDAQPPSVVEKASVTQMNNNAKSRSGFGLRDMVKRMVKKDTSIETVLHSPQTASSQWSEKSPSATATKDGAPKPIPRPLTERRLSLTSHPPTNEDTEQMSRPIPRPIPRPISGPANAGARPRTNTAPTVTIPRRFPSRKDLNALPRPRTASQPATANKPAPATLQKARPQSYRTDSQSRYYKSPVAVAIDSKEELSLPEVRPKTAASMTGAEKRAKHDSGFGGIEESEKKLLNRLSWGGAA